MFKKLKWDQNIFFKKYRVCAKKTVDTFRKNTVESLYVIFLSDDLNKELLSAKKKIKMSFFIIERHAIVRLNCTYLSLEFPSSLVKPFKHHKITTDHKMTFIHFQMKIMIQYSVSSKNCSLNWAELPNS